jgi:hypothetical protein
MKYYFEHPITIYNTPKENVVIKYIEQSSILGYPVVLNPNSEFNQAQYEKFGMDYFKKLIDTCDALIMVWVLVMVLIMVGVRVLVLVKVNNKLNIC